MLATKSPNFLIRNGLQTSLNVVSATYSQCLVARGGAVGIIARRSHSSTADSSQCSTKTTSDDNKPTFNLQSISNIKPFPRWLQGEMRSNHAGETGAVQIYEGCLWALDIRKSLGLSYNSASTNADSNSIGGGNTTRNGGSYEDNLRGFSLEHRDSEQGHVDLLDGILQDEGISKLLPAWKVAGFTLGAVSTIFCPRGMYLTTEAVETFVEEHYMSQICRLRYETAERVMSAAEEGGYDTNDRERRAIAQGNRELIALLEHCCEDEVHHKEEAKERAAEGPLPWFEWVDSSWQFLVRVGSSVAAGCAKRL